MRKDELGNVKGMNIADLISLSKKLKKEIVDLKLEKNTNKLKDIKQVEKKRRDLAKVLTVLRQKNLIAELEKGGDVSKS